MSTDSNTPAEAEATALQGCKEASSADDSCEVLSDFTMSGHAFFATARGAKKGLGVGTGPNSQTARAQALDGCRKHTSADD
ncbi:DUF4189 domain-containing protein, partial [Paraburkholderia sp. SIMBA_061]